MSEQRGYRECPDCGDDFWPETPKNVVCPPCGAFREVETLRAQVTQLQEQLAAAVEQKRAAEEQRDKRGDQIANECLRIGAALVGLKRELSLCGAADGSGHVNEIIAVLKFVVRERDTALSRVRELEQQAARVRSETIEECKKVLLDELRLRPVAWGAQHGERTPLHRLVDEMSALAPAAGGDAK